MLGMAGKKKTARTKFLPKNLRLMIRASGIANTVMSTVVATA